MAWSADSPSVPACHELAQHALAEDNKECALHCLDFALLISPEDRDCKLLKAKIEKSIEVQTVKSADPAICCEAIRVQAMAHPNLLIRSLGLQVIREFRPKDKMVATALALCLNEGCPGTFDACLKEFKEGRVVAIPKRKPLDAKLSEHLATKAMSILGDEKARTQAVNLTMAALGLDPDNDMALRAQAGLIWGAFDDSNPPPSMEDKPLIDLLLKKAATFKKTPARQKLLTRAAEAVNRANDDVILQITDLEAAGTLESLPELVKAVAGIKAFMERSSSSLNEPPEKEKNSETPPKTYSGKVIELVSPPSDDAKELVEQCKYMSLSDKGILINASDIPTSTNKYLLTIDSRHYELSASFKIESLGPDDAPNIPGFGLMFGDSTSPGRKGSGTLYIAHIAMVDGKKVLILAQLLDNTLKSIEKVPLEDSFDFLKSHEMTVVVKGKKILVKLDGTEMMTYETEALAEGGFGYFYDHCRCLVMCTTVKFKGTE